MIFPTFMWCIWVCTMNRDAQPTEEAEQVRWVASIQLETSIGNGSCGEVSLSVVWDRDLSLSIRTQEVFLVYMSLQVLRDAFGSLEGLMALGKIGKAPGEGISHLCISTSGHGWEDPEGLSRELTCFRVCLVGCVWGYQCWVSHHAVGTRCKGLS